MKRITRYKRKKEGDPRKESPSIPLKSQSKDTKKEQKKIIYESLFFNPQTMKECSVNTNIDRSNICWFVREFRKNNQVAVIKKVICPITKHSAYLLTTNPELFPINKYKQLTIF